MENANLINIVQIMIQIYNIKNILNKSSTAEPGNTVGVGAQN